MRDDELMMFENRMIGIVFMTLQTERRGLNESEEIRKRVPLSFVLE